SAAPRRVAPLTRPSPAMWKRVAGSARSPSGSSARLAEVCAIRQSPPRRSVASRVAVRRGRCSGPAAARRSRPPPASRLPPGGGERRSKIGGGALGPGLDLPPLPLGAPLRAPRPLFPPPALEPCRSVLGQADLGIEAQGFGQRLSDLGRQQPRGHGASRRAE